MMNVAGKSTDLHILNSGKYSFKFFIGSRDNFVIQRLLVFGFLQFCGSPKALSTKLLPLKLVKLLAECHHDETREKLSSGPLFLQ